MTTKSQVCIVALYSPKLSIWMLVGYQGYFRYALRMVITIKPMPWAKRASLYNHNRYSYCIWLFWANFGQLWPNFGPTLAQLWPNFGPTLVHLIHFVTGVGSSNLIYALTVVITFRNVLWPKVLGLYFQNWLFWADLVHLKAVKCWHHVSGTLEVLMTLKNMLRLKI